uniref:Uncharacterized protein n=1 Tax=Pyramimonas obovata TaxID=1411642 RepID=A0A7S0WMR7_9CHLO|eukprot:CAMPEP_0118921044 /NCGR_PEP_ID=MMETSP1169-20130426/442_1 /TAXON_ID=36882 /ORGANISM="Pyramimonas obovata, Strain CCMP722" /LENGTH=145 /DNA_ID=CAMNT_0006861695 /DNA_START=15 /DNA_END=452 /DNA_ORIENTATION=+
MSAVSISTAKPTMQSCGRLARLHAKPTPAVTTRCSTRPHKVMLSRSVSQRRRAGVTVGAMGGEEPSGPASFLTFEEAGLIDFAQGLDMHEKFLARLTVSSLNLLRIIAEEEKCSIEELNAGKVADWFTKDVERKNTSPEDAVLKW